MSRTPTVLLVLILIITFPFWIAIAAVLFGLVVGIFGGVIGIIGGIFGAIFGIIGAIFGAIFGFHSWHIGWGWPHFNGFFFAMIIIVALIINKRQNRS